MRSIISIIVFSFFLAGCTHNSPVNKSWLMPDKPVKYPVNFESKYGGTFLSQESTINLAKNFDEIDAYQKKLEFLIQEMKEYYKSK